MLEIKNCGKNTWYITYSSWNIGRLCLKIFLDCRGIEMFTEMINAEFETFTDF